MKKPSKKLLASIHLHVFKILSEEAMRHYRLHTQLMNKHSYITQKKDGTIVIDMKKFKKARKARKS